MPWVTYTGTTAWRAPQDSPSSGSPGWTNRNNVLTQNGTVATAASHSDSNGANWPQCNPYGWNFPDPRSGLPAGYTNFQVTSIQLRAKAHVGITSVPGGSHIGPIYLGWYYTGDTAFWAHPRLAFKQIYDLTSAPSNTLTWLTQSTHTAADLDPVATDYANMFNPTKVFATGTAGPFAYMYIPNVTSPVGTWNVDAYQARVTYSYQVYEAPSDTGASSGARHFFDYR